MRNKNLTRDELLQIYRRITPESDWAEFFGGGPENWSTHTLLAMIRAELTDDRENDPPVR